MAQLETSISAFTDASGTTQSVSLGSAGSNRVGLVACAHFQAATFSTLDWGSGNSVLGNTIKDAVHDGADRKRLGWYYEVAPPTASTQIDVTLSASSFDRGIIASTFSGVDQTTPLGTVSNTTDGDGGGTSHPKSLTVADSASGELVVDMFYMWSSEGATISPDASQTSIEEEETVSANGTAMGHSSKSASGANTAMSWTLSTDTGNNSWCMYGAALQNVAAGGSTLAGRLSLLGVGI